MTYHEIMQARELLELPEQASWEDIKTRYRTLIKTWHPDQCKDEQDRVKYNEMTTKINAAYAVIRAYCTAYRFSFREEEIRTYMTKEEWWFERFGNDPLWGPAQKPDP